MKRFTGACLLVFVAALSSGWWVASCGRAPAVADLAPVALESLSPEEACGITPLQIAPKWAALEDPDPTKFVANLRRVGCPEGTLRTIVKAWVESQYAQRFLSVARVGNSAAYAEKRKLKADQLEGIRHEVGMVMYGRLGLPRPLPTASFFFSAVEERWMAEATAKFPRIQANDTESLSLIRSNRIARVVWLSQVLSPESLYYYKLEREGDAERVHLLLLGLRPAKDEFLAVAKALEDRDLGSESIDLTPDVITALQPALAPERLRQLQELHTPGFRALNAFVAANRIPRDTAEALRELRRKVPARITLEYEQNVSALLVDGDLARKYLLNRQIHPDLQ